MSQKYKIFWNKLKYMKDLHTENYKDLMSKN